MQEKEPNFLQSLTAEFRILEPASLGRALSSDTVLMTPQDRKQSLESKRLFSLWIWFPAPSVIWFHFHADQNPEK